jgi:hypothetical protein
LKTKIEELTEGGLWSFVFLGANQDAWVNAQKFGIAQMNSASFNSTDKGMKNAFRSAAVNTAAFAMSAKDTTADFFSKEDQDNLKSTE